MKYSILGALFSWVFPTKDDRKEFRKLCRQIDNRNNTIKIHQRYKKIIKKIQSKSKIKVLFLVNENAKWKAQSLYDLMELSEKFEPIIALTISDVQEKYSLKEKKTVIQSNLEFFQKKQMNTIIAYDLKKDKAINLHKFKPDIVFYQQPYRLSKVQDIKESSKNSLTCYIPYYLPCYKNFKLDCDRDFHRNLYRFYVFDEEVKQIYKEHLSEKKQYSNNILGLGHTMLDKLKQDIQDKSDIPCVIYAPHWSICHEKNANYINISTFDKNGKLILEYAKAHPQIRWIFKPHPTLKTSLLKIGEMTKEEIDNYYNEWENIATCCYDAEYIELFNQSTAMITDCGSFLFEYFCTGKPLIYLISKQSKLELYPYLSKICNSFYKVKDNETLLTILDSLIIGNNDNLKTIRLEFIENLDLNNRNAALNIMNDLQNI